MDGKLIEYAEAQELTRDFKVQNYGVTYTYWDSKLVIELLSQEGAKYLAVYNGLNKGVPCLVLVAQNDESEFVGKLALEFGQSCPPDCKKVKI